MPDEIEGRKEYNDCDDKGLNQKNQRFLENGRILLGSSQNFPDDSASPCSVPCVDDQSQHMLPLFHNGRALVQSPGVVLSLSKIIHRELADRDVLSGQAGLVHEQAALDQNAIAHHLLSRIDEVSRDELVTVDLDELRVPQHSHVDLLLGHVLDLLETDVCHDVVDGGGDDGEGDVEDPEEEVPFGEVGDAHDVLQEEERLQKHVHHVHHIVRDVHRMDVHTELLAPLFHALRVETHLQIDLA